MDLAERAGQGVVCGGATQAWGAAGGFDGAAQPRYTIGALAKQLSASTSRIRSWSARGFLPVAPTSTKPVYGYRDLARARVLCRLHERGWTPANLAKAVASARRIVSDLDEALAGLDSVAVDQSGAMRLADGRVCTPDGQQLLFGTGSFGANAEVRQLRSSADWVQQAMEAEAAGRLEDAIIAYERSLPEAGVEALFNLGNCRYQFGLLKGAYEALEAAVALDPQYVEAWNNLGIASSALGRAEDAMKAFHRAVALRPHYADAHFNLADMLAARGDLEGARRHWRAYLTFDPNSRWAEQVRLRLQATEGGAS